MIEQRNIQPFKNWDSKNLVENLLAIMQRSTVIFFEILTETINSDKSQFRFLKFNFTPRLDL